jgi:hypothetical protein
MHHTAILGVWIGFAIFCVGGIARAYMDFAAHGMRMFYDFRRENTERAYWRLVKQHRALAWPFFISIVCVPLGIVMVFGSIIWSNKLGQ